MSIILQVINYAKSPYHSIIPSNLFSGKRLWKKYINMLNTFKFNKMNDQTYSLGFYVKHV